MIITAYRHDAQKYARLFDEMFRLRAKQFHDRRKWRVDVNDGCEIDRFDEADPLYVLSVDQVGKLRASLRLLPTTGPHMLADIFPETMGDEEVIRHPLIWESTRFCVDTENPEVTASGINFYTAEILLALYEVGRRNHLLNIVTVYDKLLERIVRRAGCSFDRIGSPFEYDGLTTIAAVTAPSTYAIECIRQKTQIDHDIFADGQFQESRAS